jgi:hypothetical protein
MEPQKENRWRRWLKRFGVAGFLFFLIKGLLWLAAIGGVLKFCTDHG